jgi:ribonuclease PH
LADALNSIKADLTADRPVLLNSIAAISVGVSEGGALLDLDYVEDSTAAVDMNVVMTGSGEYVEVQGTAEQRPFNRQLLDEQLSLAELGVARLTQIQRDTLGAEWPLDSNG